MTHSMNTRRGFLNENYVEIKLYIMNKLLVWQIRNKRRVVALYGGSDNRLLKKYIIMRFFNDKYLVLTFLPICEMFDCEILWSEIASYFLINCRSSTINVFRHSVHIK